MWLSRSTLSPPKKAAHCKSQSLQRVHFPMGPGNCFGNQADPNNICQATEFPFLSPHSIDTLVTQPTLSVWTGVPTKAKAVKPVKLMATCGCTCLLCSPERSVSKLITFLFLMLKMFPTPTPFFEGGVTYQLQENVCLP